MWGWVGWGRIRAKHCCSKSSQGIIKTSELNVVHPGRCGVISGGLLLVSSHRASLRSRSSVQNPRQVFIQLYFDAYFTISASWINLVRLLRYPGVRQLFERYKSGSLSKHLFFKNENNDKCQEGPNGFLRGCTPS